MAEKGTVKAKKTAKPAVEEAKPGVKAYVQAVLQLTVGWLKRRRLALLAAVLLLAVGWWGLSVLRGDNALTSDELIIRVSRELGISGDPNPAILTVEDESKVSQPFLEGAKNGDKILLYYKTRKSVLFRPSDDRIVREGNYTPPEATLFVRNGTADDAKTDEARKKLNEIKDIRLASQDASSKQDYKHTIVVNITDRYDSQAQAVAEALGAELTRLPKGETIPDADILVIVGSN